jgi:hypothetical protein
MKIWPHAVGSYSPAEVKEFCVQDAEWQKIRVSMKGVSTSRKLEILNAYMHSKGSLSEPLEGGVYDITLDRRYKVQIDNYINALKRGGQLGMDLKVRK